MESRYFRLDQRKPKIHPLRILCAASCIGAVQISFPFSCALFNPLLSSFGMSSYLQPIMWLVGPLCGVLQPLIGAYNDQSNSKWGRRRPLIVTGLLLCLAGFF
ncbi:MAG: sucrose transporter, GPH family, partial [Streblomastix strix]